MRIFTWMRSGSFCAGRKKENVRDLLGCLKSFVMIKNGLKLIITKELKSREKHCIFTNNSMYNDWHLLTS